MSKPNPLDAPAFQALVSSPVFTEVEYVTASLTGLSSRERNRQQNRVSAMVSNFRPRAAREGLEVYTRSATVGDTVYGYVYVASIPEHLRPTVTRHVAPVYKSKHSAAVSKLFEQGLRVLDGPGNVRTISLSRNSNRQYHLASRLNAFADTAGVPLRFVTKTTASGTRIDARVTDTDA